MITSKGVVISRAAIPETDPAKALSLISIGAIWLAVVLEIAALLAQLIIFINLIGTKIIRCIVIITTACAIITMTW